MANYPTFPYYYSTVARAVEAHNRIIYHLWWRSPEQLAVPEWANTKLILELLVPCPISLVIRTSTVVTGGVLSVCLYPAFVGDD